MREVKKLLFALCAFGFLGLSFDAAAFFPEVGWWWNSAQSGRGWFIEIKGKAVFLAGYFYEDDGRATWAISGGGMTDDTHFTGRLIRVTGGQTLVGPYIKPTQAIDIGEISIVWTDATHGTLTWPGGAVPIERQIFGAGDAQFQPTGWWWNALQSGRGFSIEVQGSVLDVVGFMYDGNGNPVWYISTGAMSSPTHYTGTYKQIGGGQTLTGPYKAPTSSTPIGAITIDFTALDAGTITLSDVVPPASGLKSEVVIPITPQIDPPPLADLPGNWGGTYSGTLIYDPPGADTLTLTMTGNVTFTDAAGKPNLPTFPQTATPNRAYIISGGSATITFAGTATVPVLGQSATCTISGSAPVNLLPTFGNSFLLFEANGTITGQVATASPIPFTVQASCQTPVGAIILSPQYPVSVIIPLKGRHRYNHSEGSDPIHEVAPNTQAGGTWSFQGIP